MSDRSERDELIFLRAIRQLHHAATNLHDASYLHGGIERVASGLVMTLANALANGAMYTPRLTSEVAEFVGLLEAERAADGRAMAREIETDATPEESEELIRLIIEKRPDPDAALIRVRDWVAEYRMPSGSVMTIDLKEEEGRVESNWRKMIGEAS